MKPEEEDKKDEIDDHKRIAGDAIGDTVYSERFVLKILLKFANLDTLKDEVQEKLFEEELSTLWDMAVEEEIVLFLHKHETLNLFSFALPGIESPRIVEIIIGIIGNMCCQKVVMATLLKMDSFLTFLLEYMKTDDSLILVQLLRLFSSCLFLSEEDDLAIWLDLFRKADYSTTLFFILKNSSNKELLEAALENFNTVCSYCNIEKYRKDFFSHFVTIDALDSLTTAFKETTQKQKDSFQTKELDRILVITLQISLNLLGFSTSSEIYNEHKDKVTDMISTILTYHVDKYEDCKEIDEDLGIIIDSITTIVKVLKISEICDPDKFFTQSYSLWSTLHEISKLDPKHCEFYEEHAEKLHKQSEELKSLFSILICTYIESCSEENLLKVVDTFGKDYENIVNAVNHESQTNVAARVAKYITRLKDNIDA